MDGMMSGGMMSNGMMGMMLVGTLLYWTVVIVGIVGLGQLVWQQTNDEHVAAVEILQERFARGEIDVEEYQQRRNVLQRRR